MWAFQRRGLAMDNCRLLDWDVHETWLHYMLNAMTRECPAGYHAVCSEQVIKADRELWTILACSLPDDVLRNGATILSTSGQVHVPVAIAIETLLMGSIKGGQPPEAKLSAF